MKKKMFLGAMALTAAFIVSGCSSEDGLALPPPTVEETQTPIVFSSNKGNTTRADLTGAAAAEALGGQFVVSGYKGSQTTWTDGDNIIVFDNYRVQWAENTAHTTESNSDNWEYVGKERIKHAIDNGVTQQAIKYWDYTKEQYDFIAWSTGKKTAIYNGTPADGEVLVSAITPKTAVGDAATDDAVKAYTFTGTAADLKDCYIADLVTVTKASGKYGDPVVLKFRSLGTKVRIGIYETIPGYSVKDVKFYSAADVALKDESDATDGAANKIFNETPRIFTTMANEIYTEGVYTVYYPTVDAADDDDLKADNNQAHIKFAGTGEQKTIVDFGGLNYTIAEDGEKTAGKVFLGRSSNTATFAGEAEGNYFTQYLPNETGTNLNLRVNYTLESIDGSGETITVKGATAQVPSIYTQWKAGHAYTYLFKISDKTNGHTGKYDPLHPDDTTINSDPAGLYPITFDAVVVDDEDSDNTQETITLVSTPSITTYQEGSNVVNNDEYTAGNPIYVTVSDGDKEETPDLEHSKLKELTADNAKIYTIPAGKTEAEVVDALQMQDDDAEEGTVKGRSGLVLTDAETAASVERTNEIKYGVDGNTITVGTSEVAKFTPEAATTYAFVYTKKAATTTTEIFQPVSKAKGESVKGLYRWQMGNPPAGDVQPGVKYFHSGKSDMLTVFLGQTVGNLYLDNKGQTIASGYAKTGTTYYYTTDNGMTYKAAHNVAYEDFAAATDLFTFDGSTYAAKTDDEPVNGTAYYQRTGTENAYVYTYCVILPQQTRPEGGQKLVILDTSKPRILCADNETASIGIEYFDKYSQNDGVYYTKVIKVQ